VSAHIYDLCLSPTALRVAALSAVCYWSAEDGDLTLTRDGAWFVIATPERRSLRLFSGQEAGSGHEEIGLARAALRAAANWVTAGKNMADVFLLADDRMLLVYQGDDRAGFDTDGSEASEEYLAVAPLNR
jgi:hypothetical protein